MKKQIYSIFAISGVLLLHVSIFNSCIQEDPLTLATVETIQATSITESSAVCGGVIKADGGSYITACGVCWSTSQNPTTADSTTTESYGLDSFTCILTRLIPDTTYYVRSFATNSVGTSYGNQVEFRSFGTVTDIDGNVYKYILIGNQKWMVENLKTTRYNDGISIPFAGDTSAWKNLSGPGYCFYNYDDANKNTCGAVYNWYTVYTGKLAPTGWHVPTYIEWTRLVNYLIANGYNFDSTTSENKAAKSLAATTGWASSTTEGDIGNDLTKNNTSGFSGLPWGVCGSNGVFCSIGLFGKWWSSSRHYAYNTPWACWLIYDSHYVYIDYYSQSEKDGLYVRCVMN